ncbi:MAG: desulfoferrodoxin [PVC group bacterium]
MTKRFEIYKCEVCGNIVEVLHAGAGALVCCGQEMTLMEEKTADKTIEKHVPVIEEVQDGTVVKVGSVPHPMADAHYIEWIQMISPDGVHAPRHFLKPGEPPETKFKMKPAGATAREFCNVHGLWKS